MSGYFDEVRDEIDRVVPAAATHVGAVFFDSIGNVRLRTPKSGAGFSLLRSPTRPDQTPSETLDELIGGSTYSLYPIPYLWHTSHSTTFYFSAMTKPGLEFHGVDEMPVADARNRISLLADPASRSRDLAALDAGIAQNPSPFRRILHMIRELHSMGYERLRAFMYKYPLAWQCMIVPRHWTLQRNGALLSSEALRFPQRPEHVWTYSSASMQQPFGWTDMAFATPRELAYRFLYAFPEITAAGWGKDAEYVVWFSRMLEDLAPFGIPYIYAEFKPERDRYYVQFHHSVTDYPLPPPGDASE